MNEFCIYNFARQGLSPREEMFTKEDFYSLNTNNLPDKAKNKTVLRSSKFDVKHLIENPCK